MHIYSFAEYENACNELSHLMDLRPEENSVYGKRLAALVAAIEEYDKRYANAFDSDEKAGKDK